MQRVFFGIPVDQAAQQQINDLLKPLQSSLKTVRWVPPQNWHITLGRLIRNSRLDIKLLQQTNISLQVGKITFYQSTLTPSGSIYLALKETKLNKL